tara:strand:- start:9908 stop:10099 length:192 start_codon:yes stop_codon:yes gene_type:complete
MSKSKKEKEAVKTEVLLLLLEGTRDLMSRDKELHGIRIFLCLNENPNMGKIATLRLNVISPKP